MDRLKSAIVTVIGAVIALSLFGLLAAFGLAALGVLVGLGLFGAAAAAIMSVLPGAPEGKSADRTAAPTGA